ncbi:MAG TPA: transcriptional repressor, partial [Brevibacterium sp.]|nr:transcriptional repressor [Brevibacterium sp.]
VHTHPHADTATVMGAARAELPSVSHQTVYDCLETLTVSGLVRRIQPSGSLARYETRTGDNHHHVVCHSCGAIHDVDCGVGEAPCIHPDDDHGYTIRETEVIYWGLCPRCAADQTA